MNKHRAILAAIFFVVAAASPASAQTLTTLTSFNGANGYQPEGTLTLADGILYGTTAGNGTSSAGTVFSLPVTGGSPTVLATFGGGSLGTYPSSGVIYSGSTLYGTTQQGGANGDGEVFSVPVAGGSPTVLASFSGSNGTYPNGLARSGSTLYGTTEIGGTFSAGEVFSLPVSGGSPTVIASFPMGINGPATPRSGVTISGNTLYGTALYGGASGLGEVYSVPLAGGAQNGAGIIQRRLQRTLSFRECCRLR